MQYLSHASHFARAERRGGPFLFGLSSRTSRTAIIAIGRQLTVRFLSQRQRNHDGFRPKGNATAMVKFSSTSASSAAGGVGIAAAAIGLYSNFCHILE